MDYALTALISDLHGNQPALETALRDARARGAERFVCLGDMVGYGASPLDALAWVMRLCVPVPDDPERALELPPLREGLCLRGNHEEALLLDNAEDFNPKARAAIEWTREQLNSDTTGTYWDFIGSLEPKACDEIAMFVHGSPRDPVREYLLPRDVHDPLKMRDNFAQMERDVCFVGHSHVPAIYYQDGRLFRPRGTEGPYDLGFGPENRAIVNVGSVGQPRDGDPRLSYVLFDGRTIEFVRLDYDFAKAAETIRATKVLPEYLAERLALGR